MIHKVIAIFLILSDSLTRFSVSNGPVYYNISGLYLLPGGSGNAQLVDGGAGPVGEGLAADGHAEYGTGSKESRHPDL